MKKAIKISIGFIIFFWVMVAIGTVFTLCRNLPWANAVGEWFVGCWNAVFGSQHSAAGFYNRLAELLVIFGVFLAIFTLFIIILAVKLDTAEAEDSVEAVEPAKEEKKSGKKKKETPVSDAVEETAKVVSTTVKTTNTVNDFLKSLRNK